MSACRDLPKGWGVKSGLLLGTFFIYNMSYKMLPGARDAADGQVFVAGVGVVGRIGPGPPPRSPAWHAR